MSGHDKSIFMPKLAECVDNVDVTRLAKILEISFSQDLENTFFSASGKQGKLVFQLSISFRKINAKSLIKKLCTFFLLMNFTMI